MNKLFDLNIEEVLQDWEVEHAVREIISNALDEQLLTNSKDIEISRDIYGGWHIRDFGRGLKIEHFTQNENPEKLNSSLNLIGKFGVGLKDALATFNRRDIGIEIKSRFGTFNLIRVPKSGFENILTLHVNYDDKPNEIEGTEFILTNIEKEKIDLAKSFFLKFNNESLIDSTVFGGIYSRTETGGKVYINGVFAAEEDNFMFTYNITSLTDSIKKKLNRERINVGRSTYSGRIKDILLNSKAAFVNNCLIKQANDKYLGEQYDELSWIEIRKKALNLLNTSSKVIFLTENEIQEKPDIIDWAKRDGFKVISISEKEKEKLDHQMDSGGPVIRTSEIFIGEIEESFKYKFINYNDLKSSEKAVYKSHKKIFKLVNLPSWNTPKILISETMRLTNDDTCGVWDSTLNAIVIKRSQLTSIQTFSGTLLHELGHKLSGASDCTRLFEKKLTDYLGMITSKAL
jgi:hypothetical protein